MASVEAVMKFITRSTDRRGQAHTRQGAAWPKARVAATLTVMLFACAPDGCPGAPSSDLRFLDTNLNVINQQSTAGARTYTAFDLSPVPTTALPINVDMRGSASVQPVDNQGLRGPQVEAHLFAVDLAGDAPDGLNEFLRADAAAEGSPPSTWDGRTNGSTNPMDFVVPFPPFTWWNVQTRTPPIPIVTSTFWPIIPPKPAPPASDPTGTASVKSARIYIPGLCSLEFPFTTGNNDGLFDTIADQLFLQFKQKIKDLANQSIITTATGFGNVYTRVTTLLDRGIGVTAGGTPKGGFFLYFWLEAGVFHAIRLETISVNFAGNYEFEMGLDDGRIAVTATRNGGPNVGLIVSPQSTFKDFDDAMMITFPDELHKIAITKQHVDLVKFCGGGNDPTLVARTIVAANASDGAQILGLSVGDQKRVGDAVRLPQNWECDGNGRAVFIARAKRVNIYPDAVELAWFDKEDPDDPMFGLYSYLVWARQNVSGPDPVKQLCAHAPTFAFGWNRPYVTVKRGPFTTGP